MERGLLWLPLLALFVWLAWAGWNEYQKLEAYKSWAVDFELAKYDIYAALGVQGQMLVWGVPTRQGPQHLQQACLGDIQAIELRSPQQPPPADAALPRGCNICLMLVSAQGSPRFIPFTDLALAQRWQARLQSLHQEIVSVAEP